MDCRRFPRRCASHRSGSNGHWSQTYPLVDEDAVVRRNALNCFADPMAVIDALRRVPLVRSRQHGSFSLRDVDIATNQLSPGEGDKAADEAQIQAAFASMPLPELSELLDSVAGAVASLNKIDSLMRDAAGSEMMPGFDPVSAQLTRTAQVLRAQMASHPGNTAQAQGLDGSAEGGEGGVAVPGAVKSRQDAIRALDAVAAFFKRTEPSSPIPMFLERAKRLVSKDFLEVLADIAPDARRAGAVGRRTEGRVASQRFRQEVVSWPSRAVRSSSRATARLACRSSTTSSSTARRRRSSCRSSWACSPTCRASRPSRWPPVADRKFLDIDVDNFDSRMKALKPRAAFQVPNTLTGEGNINVELTFESMDDFSPAAVARKVDALNKLLEARQQLANLITYMDGKTRRRGARRASCCRIPRCCRRSRRTKNPQDEPSS